MKSPKSSINQLTPMSSPSTIRLKATKDIVLEKHVQDDKVVFPMLEVNATNSELKLNNTKKRCISDVIDVELLNVEDLKTKKEKTRLDVHILDVMKEKEWWDKWDWEYCEALEDEYEDDYFYCTACQQTCNCILDE